MLICALFQAGSTSILRRSCKLIGTSTYLCLLLLIINILVSHTVVSDIFISVCSILFSPFVLVSDSFIFIVSMHINHSVPLGYIDIVSALTALNMKHSRAMF